MNFYEKKVSQFIEILIYKIVPIIGADNYSAVI